jgi:outer membrane protein OmpA-like peptidoglycan-associated protein
MQHKMTRKLPLLLIAATLALLAACEHEAGQNIDEGGFGDPTMINTLAMTGQATAALQARFETEVPTTVNFPFDSAQVTAEAAAVLTRQAAWIRAYPEVRFRVYGHTDLVGSASYNYSLGLRRANAVVSFFASQGISRSRLEAVVSLGKTQPVIYTSQPELRNRRTVTEVTGFVKNTSEPLNGKYAAVIWGEYVNSATQPAFQPTAATSQVDPAGN